VIPYVLALSGQKALIVSDVGVTYSDVRFHPQVIDCSGAIL